MLSSIDTAAASNSPDITVRTFKYDGREHRHWRAKIMRRLDSLIVLDAEFENEVRHPLLGTVERGTKSVEYYWLDRWYNVFRFQHPTGRLLNFYCNINVPPVLVGETLSYIDLDVDILVSPDLSYTILDEDEFAANAVRYNYPNSIKEQSLQALKELSGLIETSQFPFNDLM